MNVIVAAQYSLICFCFSPSDSETLPLLTKAWFPVLSSFPLLLSKLQAYSFKVLTSYGSHVQPPFRASSEQVACARMVKSAYSEKVR